MAISALGALLGELFFKVCIFLSARAKADFTQAWQSMFRQGNGRRSPSPVGRDHEVPSANATVFTSFPSLSSEPNSQIMIPPSPLDTA